MLNGDGLRVVLWKDVESGDYAFSQKTQLRTEVTYLLSRLNYQYQACRSISNFSPPGLFSRLRF